MYYAEFETDKYILENCFDNNFLGTMLEAGAGDTNAISMSKAFREKGWRTICVEPNPVLAESHRKENNEIYQYALSDNISTDVDFEICGNIAQALSFSALKIKYPGATNISVIKVNVTTINWLLEYLKIEKIDFVSLDVEGWELEAMKGFNTDIYQPKIILLENLKRQDSYTKYMKSIGYNLIHNLDYNYIYQRNV